MVKKLIKNKWKCLYCGDVIESKHQHDFSTCKCGKSSCDLDMMQDMCEYAGVSDDKTN